jgi:hypothetical protein
VESGHFASYVAFMSTDAQHWLELGWRLGIEVIAPVELDLAGVKADFTALLPQFGAPAGMIVDADWAKIEPHTSALLAAGYAYSCVDGREAADFDDPEVLACTGEMLADWGWSSDSAKPEWLRS